MRSVCHEKWMAVWPWCWLSASGILFAVFALGYGYDRTFAANQFPRTLMIWSRLAAARILYDCAEGAFGYRAIAS